MPANGFALSLVPDLPASGPPAAGGTAVAGGDPAEIVRFLEQVEEAATGLEKWSNDDRSSSMVAPEIFAASRAKLRIIIAQCAYVRHVLKLSSLSLAETKSLGARLDDVEDRFGELDDSLSWASDAPDAIKRLALEEIA